MTMARTKIVAPDRGLAVLGVSSSPTTVNSASMIVGSFIAQAYHRVRQSSMKAIFAAIVLALIAPHALAKVKPDPTFLMVMNTPGALIDGGVYTGCAVVNSPGATVQNATFNIAAGSSTTWGCRVVNSDGAVFVLDHFSGPPAYDLATAPSLLFVSGSRNVRVSHSSFRFGHNMLAFSDDGFQVDSSTFDHAYGDGVHGGCANGVRILNNKFTDMDGLTLEQSPQHPDAIQIWANGCKAITSGFVISGNFFQQVNTVGAEVHMLLMRANYPDSPGPFQNVTITGNIGIGDHDCINVASARNVISRGNVCRAYCPPAGPNYNGTITWIDVQGLIEIGDSASHYSLEGKPAPTPAGNSVASCVPAP